MHRFAQARCCPLCRTEAYQKRQIHDGREAHKYRCAAKVQAAVRGYLARKWYRHLRRRLPPQNPILMRKWAAEQLQVCLEYSEHILHLHKGRHSSVEICAFHTYGTPCPGIPCIFSLSNMLYCHLHGSAWVETALTKLMSRMQLQQHCSNCLDIIVSGMAWSRTPSSWNLHRTTPGNCWNTWTQLKASWTVCWLWVQSLSSVQHTIWRLLRHMDPSASRMSSSVLLNLKVLYRTILVDCWNTWTQLEASWTVSLQSLRSAWLRAGRYLVRLETVMVDQLAMQPVPALQQHQAHTAMQLVCSLLARLLARCWYPPTFMSETHWSLSSHI